MENSIEPLSFPGDFSEFEAGKVYSFVFDGYALTLNPAEPVSLTVMSAYTAMAGGASSPDVPVPAGLAASAMSADTVGVSWHDTPGTLYYVYRSGSAGGTYTFAGTAQGGAYTDSGLDGNTWYYYKVRAYAGGKFSEYTNYVSAETTMPPPQGVTAETFSTSAIKISWQNVTLATSYEVYRSETENGSYTSIGTSVNTEYTDTGLTADTVYYYRVRAKSGSQYSGYSAAAFAAATDLQAPAGLIASAGSSTQITLTWNSVPEATGYYIYRAASSAGNYASIGNVSGTSFNDTGLTSGTTYYYKVRSYKNGVYSNYSAAVYAATTVAVPTNLQATAISDSQISVSWDEPSGGAQYYYIYTAVSASGPWTQTAYVSTTSYTHSGLTEGQTYYYKVRAYRNGVYSGDSVVVSTVIVAAGLYIQNSNGYTPISGVAQPFSIASALTWLRTNAQANTAYTIVINANETLAPQTLSTANLNGKTGVSITLKGFGRERTVQLRSNGAMFTVGSGITLTLEENVTLVGRSSNTASLVNVESGGILVMNERAKISGNNAADYITGGGVYVGGTFTMNGGEISGNTAYCGGGVHVSSPSTFTMNGGEISGNAASYLGGGVYVSGPSTTFTMNGGEISGNTASYCGGGVYVNIGTFKKLPASGSGTSGIIYGYSAGDAKSNKVTNSGAVQSGWGHAVWIISIMKRETTAGETDHLDSTVAGTAGGWE
jgi:fibronectin type 3 domain-containing protein